MSGVLSDQTPSAEQADAIRAPLEPILVLAGPGAGKTFCLIERIGYLVEHRGLSPERILALTFTNRAAGEISQRLRGRLGERADDVDRGTIHSICLRELRARWDSVGLKKGFGIADEPYQIMALRRIGVRSPREARDLLRSFNLKRSGHLLDADLEQKYVAYINQLRARNMIDFDDIIHLTAELLRNDERCCDEIAGQWDAVLVDEFQDLSRLQYDIVRLLSERHLCVFAVGDDEQSIFSWAGAEKNVLGRFATDFEIPNPIFIRHNHRCSRQIFEKARRLLVRNPSLWEKELEATRDSEFEVTAHLFADEREEAAWIVSDIQRDRARSGLPYGEYAILYRQHVAGVEIEKALIREGVPCRLARGRALMDDDVVAFVTGSLRMIRAPEDSVAVEVFAERSLPAEIRESLRSYTSSQDESYMHQLRRFARERQGTVESARVWRLIFHVQNLRAVYEANDDLAGMVQGLLSQFRPGKKTRLEREHDRLSDPLTFPGAAPLADQLRSAMDQGRHVVLDRTGHSVALAGILHAADFHSIVFDEDADGVRLDFSNVRGTRSMALFKAVQILNAPPRDHEMRDFVAFDLETTDREVESCGIVEIGAVRVRDGEIVGSFRRMINPERPISRRATEVHGYRDEDVRDAPVLSDAWSDFMEFVGTDVLVAHNGQTFDVPVLERCARGYPGVGDLVFFDTLPLARSIAPGNARLEDLAERYRIDKGRAHHADDDARTLASVLIALNDEKHLNESKAVVSKALAYVALGMALECDPTELEGEEELLFDLGSVSALGRYSDCLNYYSESVSSLALTDAVSLDEVIDLLGGRNKMQRLRAEKSAAERFPDSVQRLEGLVAASEAGDKDESIQRFLENVALSTSAGVEADPSRVNLLTLHATKGLEFSRVYVTGMEDHQVPGYYATVDEREDEIEEARRLVYVGLTRARDRLVLTRAAERRGRPAGGNRYLDELGIVPEEMGTTA